MTTQSHHHSDCPVCAARTELTEALSAEVKAAARVYDMVTRWRTAHERREVSNQSAEERSIETIAQFDADTENEALWFGLYEEALRVQAEAATRACQARAAYRERLTEYTRTRTAKAGTV